MFLLTLKDRKDDGAYAVQNKLGEKVLVLFEEEDDATRYAMMLEEDEDEVEIVTIGSKKYYVNQETKDVYEFLKNEDIGDFIGKLENNKLVKKKV